MPGESSATMAAQRGLPLRPGMVVSGKFVLLRVLGEGAMSAVPASSVCKKTARSPRQRARRDRQHELRGDKADMRNGVVYGVAAVKRGGEGNAGWLALCTIDAVTING